MSFSNVCVEVFDATARQTTNRQKNVFIPWKIGRQVIRRIVEHVGGNNKQRRLNAGTVGLRPQISYGQKYAHKKVIGVTYYRR